MSTSKRQGNLLALSGVFFAAFFIASLVLGGVLASAPFPLPYAPNADVVRFYEGSRVAALASSSLQALSAVSLYTCTKVQAKNRPPVRCPSPFPAVT